MDSLRKRIVSRIEADWPLTLEEWDRFEETTHPKKPYDWDYCPRWETLLLEPVAAIRLARAHDIPQILPAAFYHLSKISVKDNWKECCSQHCNDVEEATSRYGARWDLADGDIFKRLVHGQQTLDDSRFVESRKIFRKITRLRKSVDTDTYHSTECKNAFTEMMDNICRPLDAVSSRDILGCFQRIESYLVTDGVCDPCRDMLLDYRCYDIPECREAIWSTLQGAFKIGS